MEFKNLRNSALHKVRTIQAFAVIVVVIINMEGDIQI